MTATLSARDYLDAEKNKMLADAKSIAATAANEGRGMTADEKAKAEDLVAQAAKLKTRVEDMLEAVRR